MFRIASDEASLAGYGIQTVAFVDTHVIIRYFLTYHCVDVYIFFLFFYW